MHQNLDGPPVDSSSDGTPVPPSVAPVRASTSSEPVVLWLRRGDQLIVGLLVAALVVLLGIHWIRLSRWGMAPVELSSQRPREYYYSLDINSATWVEWAQLDGIGEKLAKDIVADRELRGPFRNPDDVGRVRKIGPKTLQSMKPFLKGGTETPPHTNLTTKPPDAT